VSPTYEKFDALPAWVEAVWDSKGRTTNRGGDLVWSGPAAPPILGERVFLSVNRLGHGQVAGYFGQGGFLGVLVALEKPPEWYVLQNGATTLCHAFGAEVKPA
jgi:hypothetical protein